MNSSEMMSKYHDYDNCKICNEIRDSDHGYNDDPDTAAVQMYRHVPDCTDCKAMANLTSTHLAEIKVEEGRIKSDGRVKVRVAKSLC